MHLIKNSKVSDIHSIGEELFPEFRGRDLFTLLLKSSHNIMKNEGYKRCYSETYIWNKRAVKANLKIGSRKVGIATRLKIFGKNVVIWHDMSSDKIKLK